MAWRLQYIRETEGETVMKVIKALLIDDVNCRPIQLPIYQSRGSLYLASAQGDTVLVPAYGDDSTITLMGWGDLDGDAVMVGRDHGFGDQIIPEYAIPKSLF